MMKSSPTSMLRVGHAATILLVDDDASLRRFARSILIREGYHVIEAADGAEALEIASKHVGDFELLLTDVIMPKVNGLALADRMTEERPGIRVIYMSGYVEGLMLVAKRPGSTLMPKPFTSKRLIATVGEALAPIQEQRESGVNSQEV